MRSALLRIQTHEGEGDSVATHSSGRGDAEDVAFQVQCYRTGKKTAISAIGERMENSLGPSTRSGRHFEQSARSRRPAIVRGAEQVPKPVDRESGIRRTAIRRIGKEVKHSFGPDSARWGKLIDLPAAKPLCTRRFAAVCGRAKEIPRRIENYAAIGKHAVGSALKSVERAFGPGPVRSMQQLEDRPQEGCAAGVCRAIQISGLVEGESAGRKVSFTLMEAIQQQISISRGGSLKFINCAVAELPAAGSFSVQVAGVIDDNPGIDRGFTDAKDVQNRFRISRTRWGQFVDSTVALFTTGSRAENRAVLGDEQPSRGILHVDRKSVV